MSEVKKEKESKETKECPKCGNVWTPRVPNPLECPSCKYRLKYGKYTTISKEYVCAGCGHEWKSRRKDDDDPLNCPKCKTPEYTKEAIAQKKAERLAKKTDKKEKKKEE